AKGAILKRCAHVAPDKYLQAELLVENYLKGTRLAFLVTEVLSRACASSPWVHSHRTGRRTTCLPSDRPLVSAVAAPTCLVLRRPHHCPRRRYQMAREAK